MAQVTGTVTGDECRAQVKNLKEKVTKIVARSDDSRAGRTAHQNFEEIWGYHRRFLSKKEKFDKNFHHFLSLFGFQRGLSSSKGRSPIRASVRTQASEIKRRESRNALNVKMRMIRQQSDGLEQAKREQFRGWRLETPLRP